MGAEDFEQVMHSARNALDSIAKGDPAPYKELFSPREDITLGNPFGGFGKGRSAVHEQLERAASYYRDGRVTSIETVSQAVGPELAYTVEIERFEARVGGAPEISEIALRTTCVYRRERDGWKVLHRHADPAVSRQPARSVIRDP